MKAERLINLICHPENIKDDDLRELDTLLNHYPYFQAARILYLKALNNSASARFRNEFKAGTLHITDHKQFFRYLNDQIEFDYPAPDSIEKDTALSNIVVERIKEINGYITVNTQGIPASRNTKNIPEKNTEDESVSINFNGLTPKNTPEERIEGQPKISPAQRIPVTDPNVFSNPIILDGISGVLDDYSADSAVSSESPYEVVRHEGSHKYVIEPVSTGKPVEKELQEEVLILKNPTEFGNTKVVHPPLDLVLDDDDSEDRSRYEVKATTHPVEKQIFETPEIIGSFYQPEDDEINDNANLAELAGQLKRKKSKKNVDKGELIDRFMTKEATSIRVNPEFTDNRDLSETNSIDKEELFTETLAKIYIKQKLYEKAVATYIKLSLKYPEKSVYFANRIEKIKEYINNNE